MSSGTRLLLLLACTALSACPASPGQLEERDLNVDFGAVMMGQVATQKVELRNVGGSALTRLSLEVIEGDASPFELGLDASAQLEPGEALGVLVRFHAPMSAAAADYSLRLRLSSDGAEAATLTLRARTVDRTCDLPEKLDFGAVSVGGSAEVGFELVNATSYPATAELGQLYSTSGDHTAFRFVSGDTDLPPETSRSFVVEFRPSEQKKYVAFVAIQAAKDCPARTLTLTGNGLSTLVWTSPATLDFGYAPPGFEVSRTLTFVNVASSPVTLTQFEIAGSTEFTADATQLVIPAATLEAWGQWTPGEATLPLRCQPEVTGARQSALTFRTDLPSQPVGSVPLKAFGGGPDIDVSPAALNFGKVAYFASGTSFQRKTVRVSNVGTAPATPDPSANLLLGKSDGAGGHGLPFAQITPQNVDTGADEFTVSFPPTYDPNTGLEAKLGANTAELVVEFRPKSVGLKKVKLSVFSNDPDEPVVDVVVTAEAVVLPPCNYSVKGTPLNFGVVGPGDERERSFTIANNGTNAGDVCTLSGLRLAPGSSSLFSLPAGPIDSRDLQPGEELTVIVRATGPAQTPSGVTNVTGQVDFFMSSDINPQPSVSLWAQLAHSCLTLAPNAFDFGTVKLGCASAARTFNLYAACDATTAQFQLQNVAVQCPGGPCTEFSIAQAPSIPGGGLPFQQGSAPLVVEAKYQPSAVGSDSAMLAVSGSHGGVPVTYLVPLSGRADAQGLQTERYTLPAHPRADILFVIDDSTTTEDEQLSLGSHTSFIQYAQAQLIDFRIAVIKGNSASNPVFVTGPTHPETVLTAGTPNLASKFADKVHVGVLGLGNEVVADPALRALTYPYLHQYNTGFLRRDATLAIISLTDTPDQSPNTTAYYLDQLLNLKGHQRREQLTFSAIGGFDSTCPGDDGKLAFYANATAGMKFSMCTNDWPGELAKLWKVALGIRTRYFLDSAPDLAAGAIEVKLDGTVMPPVASTGAQHWTYDPVANAIVFTELYAPQPGQSLELSYPTICSP